MQNTAYNLVNPTTPVLSGLTLAFLTNVVEVMGEFTGISHQLAKDAGLYILRDIEYDEPPTTMPVWTPTERMVGASQSDNVSTLSPAEYLAAVQALADESLSSTSKKPIVDGFKPLSCRDYYIVYKSKKTTPVKVIEQMLDAVDESKKISPPLGAVWKSVASVVMKQAKESAERYSQGCPKSILDGVPVIVKDEVDVEGYVTTVGTSFLNKDSPALEDAYLVAQLRAHGAIIIGKSTMHEIGLGVTNFNPSTTTPRNPYNPEHSTGGSSGGSGAAVGSG
ncbi:hypothetical protein BGZ94_002483, partial [Podila epigama]